MLSRAVATILSSYCLLQAQPRIVPELQVIEDRALAQMLTSSDPVEQAWGAHLAGNFAQSKWEPDLRRLIASWHPDVQMQALDALIRLDADVPSQELMPLWPQHREPVLILLAKKPQDNKDALHFLTTQEVTNEEWVAVHNLLISIKAPELALELLKAVEMKITVAVADTGTLGMGRGAGGGSVGCRVIAYRPGFPPMVFYRLSNQPVKGDTLLTPGLHPIYYRRQPDSSQHSALIDRNLYRYDFLAELMGKRPESLAVEPYVSRTIVWRGADEYVTSIKQLRDSAHEQFRRLLAQLQEAHVLSARDAGGLKVQLKIEAVDLRENPTPLLPAVDVQ